ncbi:MAG TPA: hypothetical protein VNB49_19110, partial [Candidatus Dormibacteraeota bacterium]|nr:hypothetical protein [Candidatus Dormibacteraeota bacterium]
PLGCVFPTSHPLACKDILPGALMAIAETPDSRTPLLLLAEILRTPGLFERLVEVLRPDDGGTNKQDRGGVSPETSLRN